MRELTRFHGSMLRRRGRSAARLVPLACATALSGCYTFASAAPGSLPMGSHVRVALTDEGAAGLAPVVGSSVSGIEGSVVRGGGDTLVVRADRLLTTADVDVAWRGGELALPATWRRGIDHRQLSVGRTTLLVVGGAAVGAGLIALVRHLGDAGGDPGGNGGPVTLSRRRP